MLLKKQILTHVQLYSFIINCLKNTRVFQTLERLFFVSNANSHRRLYSSGLRSVKMRSLPRPWILEVVYESIAIERVFCGGYTTFQFWFGSEFLGCREKGKVMVLKKSKQNLYPLPVAPLVCLFRKINASEYVGEYSASLRSFCKNVLQVLRN